MQPIIGKRVSVVVDRPMFNRHPEHEDIVYPVNYGYVPGIMAEDGEWQDAYILGANEPIAQFAGVVTGILIRKEEQETKWVVEPEGQKHLSDEEILSAVAFQEQFFTTRLVRKNAITVIGSSNIDIHGEPTGAYRAEDSNPGIITLSVGGVGCNIARNLSALGWDVHFITALAQDTLSEKIRSELSAHPIDYSQAVVVPEGRTSSYLYVTDANGNMVSAVSDMALTEALSPEAVSGRLSSHPADTPLVFDANCSQETIAWIAQHVPSPLIADSVSAAKVQRLAPALSRLSILKCNEMEAYVLTGAENLQDAAQRLLDAGVRQVYITLGTKGVCVADSTGIRQIPGVQARIVRNTTGAGDSFLAGAVTAHFAGQSLEEGARFAAATAALTCESAEAVHEAMSAENVLALLQA